MSNKKVYLYITILLYIASISNLYSNNESEKLNDLVKNGKEQLYQFKLDSSMQIFRGIQEKFPKLPHGYFYEAYIYAIYYSQDKTNKYLDSTFISTVKRAIEIGEEYKYHSDNSIESLYYLGISHGLFGIYQGINKSYIKAYIHGRKGKNYLNNVIKMDSTYYDAYLGLGVYHYYVDLLPGILKFFAKILGFEGNREKGINEIELTYKMGTFFKIEAEFCYATIRYFLEGERVKSLKLFLSLEKRYPENPALPLIVGYHFRRHGQINSALYYFNRVSESFTESLPQITIMKFYNLAVCYFRLNNFEKAEYYFDKIMNSNWRVTPYYQAALTYYKGQLSGLKNQNTLSQNYFQSIKKNKETEYWFYASRIFIKNPIDSLFKTYIYANNNVYSSNFRTINNELTDLIKFINVSRKSNNFRPIYYLVNDLNARFHFRKGDIKKAEEIYRNFIDNVDKFDDRFQRSWIYINYSRVLREQQLLDEAREMLDKAKEIDDKYTRLIIEREQFIINNLNKKS